MEFLLLGLAAGIGVASVALWQRARKAERAPGPSAGGEPKRLVAPTERTPLTAQVGDVVQHLGSDYLVEGVATFSDDDHAARFFRLFDDGREHFLYVKAGSSEPLLLKPSAGWPLEGAPPEMLEHQGVSYRQTVRFRASAVLVGQMGTRRAAERVGLFEYAGAGPARLLVVEWGAGELPAELFVGERALATTLEILPSR